MVFNGKPLNHCREAVEPIHHPEFVGESSEHFSCSQLTLVFLELCLKIVHNYNLIDIEITSRRCFHLELPGRQS